MLDVSAQRHKAQLRHGKGLCNRRPPRNFSKRNKHDGYGECTTSRIPKDEPETPTGEQQTTERNSLKQEESLQEQGENDAVNINEKSSLDSLGHTPCEPSSSSDQTDAEQISCHLPYNRSVSSPVQFTAETQLKRKTDKKLQMRLKKLSVSIIKATGERCKRKKYATLPSDLDSAHHKLQSSLQISTDHDKLISDCEGNKPESFGTHVQPQATNNMFDTENKFKETTTTSTATKTQPYVDKSPDLLSPDIEKFPQNPTTQSASSPTISNPPGSPVDKRKVSAYRKYFVFHR